MIGVESKRYEPFPRLADHFVMPSKLWPEQSQRSLAGAEGQMSRPGQHPSKVSPVVSWRIRPVLAVDDIHDANDAAGFERLRQLDSMPPFDFVSLREHADIHSAMASGFKLRRVWGSAVAVGEDLTPVCWKLGQKSRCPGSARVV